MQLGPLARHERVGYYCNYAVAPGSSTDRTRAEWSSLLHAIVLMKITIATHKAVESGAARFMQTERPVEGDRRPNQAVA